MVPMSLGIENTGIAQSPEVIITSEFSNLSWNEMNFSSFFFSSFFF